MAEPRSACRIGKRKRVAEASCLDADVRPGGRPRPVSAVNQAEIVPGKSGATGVPNQTKVDLPMRRGLAHSWQDVRARQRQAYRLLAVAEDVGGSSLRPNGAALGRRRLRRDGRDRRGQDDDRECSHKTYTESSARRVRTKARSGVIPERWRSQEHGCSEPQGGPLLTGERSGCHSAAGQRAREAAPLERRPQRDGRAAERDTRAGHRDGHQLSQVCSCPRRPHFSAEVRILRFLGERGSRPDVDREHASPVEPLALAAHHAIRSAVDGDSRPRRAAESEDRGPTSDSLRTRGALGLCVSSCNHGSTRSKRDEQNRTPHPLSIAREAADEHPPLRGHCGTLSQPSYTFPAGPAAAISRRSSSVPASVSTRWVCLVAVEGLQFVSSATTTSASSSVSIGPRGSSKS